MTLLDEPMVTYTHAAGDGKVRFRQFKKDVLPKWATDVRDVPHLDLNKVHDVEVEGIDLSDYPDFCDAYISFATYDGREMTPEELEALNERRDFVYEQILNRVR